MLSYIKQYKILQELGGGGFAKVYLALDEQLHREVAIKVLHSNLADNIEYRRFFEREARIVASLEHLAVVPIYDYGEIEGQLYLVMRYMRGGTLADRLSEAKKALPLAEVIALLERLAPTFDAMHERGVIHRDLKPANILYDEGGAPFIADFGIARMQEMTSHFTQTGVSFGTPQYSSPEQITGEGVLDHRSDIYSLGIILYQLLTTEYPFWSDTPLGWVHKHVEAPIPDIRKVNGRLPQGVTAVIDRMLAKQAEDRYDSVSAVLDDLKRAEAGKALIAAPPPLPGTVPMQPEAFAQASDYLAPKPSAQASDYLAPKPSAQESDYLAPKPSTFPIRLVTLGLMVTAIIMVLVVGALGYLLLQNSGNGGTTAGTVSSPSPSPSASPSPSPSASPPESPSPSPQSTEGGASIPAQETPTPIPSATTVTLATAVIPTSPPPDLTATALQQVAVVGTAQAVAAYQQLPDALRNRPAFFAPFASTVPQLDGDLSEWATQAFNEVPYITYLPENIQGTQDLSGSCAAQWTFDALILACSIRDDRLVQLSTGNRLYEGDGFELHFDTRLEQDLERGEMDGDDYQIGVLPGDAVGRQTEAYRWFPLNAEGVLPDVQVGSRSTAEGYTVEMLIPWRDISINPRSKSAYGFSLVVNDNDTPDTTAQESQLSLFESHQWATPPSWGLLILLDAP